MATKISKWLLKLDENVTAGLSKITNAGNKAGQGFDRAGSKASAFGSRVSGAKSSVIGLNSALSAGVGLIGSYFAISGIKSIAEATANVEAFNNAISFSSGSTKEAKANLKFLNETVDNLGLSLDASRKGFKTFTGAAIGSTIQGEKARKIFLSVSKASSVMGLSADNQEGTLLALGQMLSKGKVQAEELRGQLGERLPGAFQIAARAMNVTTAQLDKMLQSGSVIAEDFLPKFADELDKTFQKGVPKAAQALRAQMNRLENETMRFKEAVGASLAPSLSDGLVSVTAKLKAMRQPVGELVNNLIKLGSTIFQIVKPALKTLFSLFNSLIGFVNRNSEVIITLTQVLVGSAVAYKAVSAAIVIYTTVTKGAAVGSLLFMAAVNAITIATKIYTLWTSRAAIVTAGFKVVMAALNFIMSMNPVSLIVIGIAALTAGLYLAWENSETFRNTLKGVWEVIKAMLQPVKGLGTALAGLMAFDVGMVKQGVAESVQAFKDMDLEQAFNKPFKEAEKMANATAANSTAKAAAQKNEASGLLRTLAVPTAADSTSSSLLTDNSTTEKQDNNSITEGLSKVSGGGATSRNVSVSFGDLVGIQNLNTSTLGESLDDAEEKMRQFMVRVLGGAEQLVS